MGISDYLICPICHKSADEGHDENCPNATPHEPDGKHRITLDDLRRRYDSAMRRYDDYSDVNEANAAHRQACEIGYMLHDLGFGPAVDIPENTERNLDAAEEAGALTLTLPDGYSPADLTRARWR